MGNTKNILESLIHTLINIPEAECSRDVFVKAKRARAKTNAQPNVPTNIQVLKTYMAMVARWDLAKTPHIEQLLKKRSIRSASGIVAVQVLTKPFRCPGECIFCPNDATMPKSYVNTQPGAMRALLNQFDPYKQVYNRLLSLTLTWHDTDKIEMIVLGWTRDVYPKKYKTEFIKWLYDACNSFPQFLNQIEIDYTSWKSARYTVTKWLGLEYPKHVEESIEINENSKQRIIWLTVETRPEYVTHENCQFRRKLWVTRLEMGIQTLHNDVHIANKRWHDNVSIRDAMHMLRQYGFKISNHYMPGLYTSTPKKDKETFEIAFSTPWIKSDELKFYPTAVIPNTPLFDLYKKGAYKPISDDDLKKIIYDFKLEIVPAYSRIKRLARDFDTNEVVAGANTPNIRQLVMNKMDKEFYNSESLRSKQYQRLLWTAEYKKFTILDDLMNHLSLPMGKKTYSYKSSSDEIWEIDDRLEVASLWGCIDFKSKRNFVCLCTRCREVRQRDITWKDTDQDIPFLVVRRYRSSVWEELFLSFEDNLWYLHWFARCLLPDSWNTIDFIGLWDWVAIVRELHVYGTLQSLKESDKNITDVVGEQLSAQHKWYGTRLMMLAERISKKRGFSALSVISWVWVRWFYKKIWYSLVGTYMKKIL